MKKIICITIMAIAITFISGCNLGRSMIRCHIKSSNTIMSIEQTYLIYYSNNNVTSVNVDKIYSFNDKDSFSKFQTIIDNTASDMDSFNKNYITFDVSKEDLKYVTQLTIDMKNITTNEIEVLDMSKEASEFQTILENNGLTCK